MAFVRASGFARFDGQQRVGSSSSTDRTADVRPASDVDQRRKTMSDWFGEWSPSSGRRPMTAVLLKPVIGMAIFLQIE